MENRAYRNYEDRYISAFTVFAKAADNTLWANADFTKGLDLDEFASAYKSGDLLINNDGALLKAVAFTDGTVSTIGESGLVDWTITEALKATGVAVEAQATTMYGYSVSDLQGADVAIADGAITGTLKYIDSGSLADFWGPGYFLALKFTVSDLATSVKVGLNPSVSSGLVEIIDDPDKNGAFKISNKELQKVIVITTDGETIFKEYFDLSGLTLEEPAVEETVENNEEPQAEVPSQEPVSEPNLEISGNDDNNSETTEPTL